MEINSYLKAVNAYTLPNAEKESKAKPVAQTKAKNTDKAEFSVGSKSAIETMRAYTVTAAQSSVSPERIAALKAAIADGSYNVSSNVIAAAMTQVDAKV